MNLFAMITTKSSKRYTDLALQTFLETTPLQGDDQIIIIDNDRADPYELVASSKALEIIRNPAPLGFAANVNQALRIARDRRADLYFLNNDLVFAPGWFEPQRVNEPWILSPLSNRELPYKTEHFCCNVEMSLEYYRDHRDGFRQLVAEHQRNTNAFLNMLVLPFFCVKLPYAVYSVVGEFDERYGKGGGEDFDYCLRAILAGFPVKYAAPGYVLHFGGKSSWSGAETRAQQQQREEHFFSHFRTVWGEQLTELVLRDKQSLITDNPALVAAVKAGDYRKVILTLAPNCPH